MPSSASDMGRRGLGDGEMGLEVGGPAGMPAAQHAQSASGGYDRQNGLMTQEISRQRLVTSMKHMLACSRRPSAALA